MRIKIAERLRPFSHTPGISLVIPGSTYEAQVFPALVIVRDLSTSKVLAEIPLSYEGPVKKFTVQLDLESGNICVWGHAANGFFRYYIVSEEPFVVREKKPPSHQKLERLSLGNHKLQDWDLVCRRLDLKEILPIWHRLGQIVPEATASGKSLLENCLSSHSPEKIAPALTNLFLAGFQGILSPRSVDEKFQGFPLPPIGKGSPLALLSEGAKLIRRLFIETSRNEIKILPVLPPELHAGRLLHANCGNLGEIDLEWTKKTIRCLIFRSHAAAVVNFKWQSGLKQFRLRAGESDRGVIHSCQQPLEIKKGIHYFFDNFQR